MNGQAFPVHDRDAPIEVQRNSRHSVPMGPFIVDKETIAALGDELLRELLVRLLEAEARQRGIPLSSIHAGGNQTAPDGGVDVAIHWEGGPSPNGWLPARSIAFQCKAERMRVAEIGKEMRSNGKPRPLLSKLVSAGGAYVMFTTDDPAGLKHDERLQAMREVALEVDGGSDLLLRFFGADQIARWTSEHIGVSLWLLDRIGRGLTGWTPFGDWSSPGSAGKPYIAGTNDRVHVGGVPRSATEALDEIRERLREPGGTVRLIGISGMGKTRFAEALFDANIGAGSLAPALAIYADAGHELSVGLPVLTQQLAGSGVAAVVVADNCPGRLHAQAAAMIRRSPGHVSLLTIDHELLEDVSDGTLVAQMGGNTPEAIAGLLEQRCPWLSSSETSHLVDFSGGNARVALKIAGGSRDGVDIASFNDTQMLDRLFQADRQAVGPESRRCADAASLVYAFYADKADHEKIEHPTLAALVGMEPQVFYQEVARLIDFGVAQRRGPQRAIMPPPIANMLAKVFIRRADLTMLIETFERAPVRLFKSFARRLGDLHALPEAVSLANSLLAAQGALGEPAILKAEMRQAFIKLAPAAPGAAVDAIRRSQAGPNAAKLVDVDREARRDFASLLARIAHDKAMFIPAMEAMLPFLLAETPRQGRHSVAEHFHQRFWPRLSFTLASQDTRLAFIDRLLDDDNPNVRTIGVEALDHMLSTYFSSSMSIGFGSRAVNRQWSPPGTAGYRTWCGAAYSRLVATAREGDVAGSRAKEVVAENFRQQLSAGGNDMPVDAMKAVRGLGYWDEGWNALCEALSFHRSSFTPELVPTVEELEREFRPRTPDELFEAFVMGAPWRHWKPSGRERHSARPVERLAQRFGACLARRGLADGYIARAVAIRGQSSVYYFAQGVGRATADRDATWRRAHDRFAALPTAERNASVFAGLLAGVARTDTRWVEERLDAATQDPVLKSSLVTLHLGVPMDRATMRRFAGALRDGSVPPPHFESLMYGGVSESIAADELADFLRELFTSQEGANPAIQILRMRFHGDKDDKRPIAPDLVQVAREFVADPRSYDEGHAQHDRSLDSLAKVALAGEGAEEIAKAICRALLARPRSNSSDRDFDSLCQLLLRRFPGVVLEEIVEPQHADNLVSSFFGGMFRDDDDGATGPETFDIDAALSWVARDPSTRPARLAEHVRYFARDEATGNFAWSPIALALIDAASDPVKVLEVLERRFWSGGGSGSFASRFVRRRPMVAAMEKHSERRVRNWALEEDIRVWDERDRRTDPRFE